MVQDFLKHLSFVCFRNSRLSCCKMVPEASANVSQAEYGDIRPPNVGQRHDLQLIPSLLSLTVLLAWDVGLLRNWKDALRDLLIAFLIAVRSVVWQWGYIGLRGLLCYLSHEITILSLLGVVCLLIMSYIAWGTTLSEAQLDEPPVFRPTLLPCRTTHTRLVPTKHSFSYSYLYVGIPVGWAKSAGSILSADSDTTQSKTSWPRNTWFSVESEDYLERGHHARGLAGKLGDYLVAQGIDPSRYGHAYLVTAPRFMGFSFNPVSLWYLYMANGDLAAMILEVNNTFDERRMYFMERHPLKPDDEQVRDQNFSHKWEKDFHVSPFNSRDGSYSLSARDLFSRDAASYPHVDCSITLTSAQGTTKLVARVFSIESAVDAMRMTRWETLAFVWRWWWVGFMTNPRILREARQLWVKKLQVYYRPEVLRSSIGRQESVEEVYLESAFRLFLQRLVESSSQDVGMVYIAAAGSRRGVREKISPQCLSDVAEIEMRVLTPAFYSHFVKFRSPMEAFDKLCFEAAGSGQFVLSSNDNRLKLLLRDFTPPHLELHTLSLRWHMLGYLRAASTVQSAGSGIYARPGRDDDQLGLSQLDRLVITNVGQEHARMYCEGTMKALIADRVAYGFQGLLSVYNLTIRAVLIIVASQCLRSGLPAEMTGSSRG